MPLRPTRHSAIVTALLGGAHKVGEVALAFHRTPFRPCRSPGAIIDGSNGDHSVSVRGLSDDLFLRGFCCTLSDTARVSSGVAGERLRPPQESGLWHSQPAAALATLLTGHRCLAAICRRDDAQRAHFAGKRQPTRRSRSNSNLFSARPVWEAMHGLGRGRPRLCQRQNVLPAQSTQSASSLFRCSRSTVTVCGRDPAPLIGCGQS